MANAESFSEGPQALREAFDVVNVGIELSDETTLDIRDEITQPVMTPVQAPPEAAAEEVPSGVHDPVFPLVIIGALTLIAIFVIAAILAL